jgi:hypothetical protein
MNWTQTEYDKVKHLLPEQRGNVEIENFIFLQALQYINKNGCCWQRSLSGVGQRTGFSSVLRTTCGRK